MGEVGMGLQPLRHLRLVTHQEEAHALEPAACRGDASQHDRQPLVAAHRIDGDPGSVGHGCACIQWVKRALALDRDDLATVIMAAGGAQIVRTLQFAAVRALLERRDAERVVATAHAALRGRGLSLGDGHFGTLF
ncbi:hypothetical protein WR25_13352 [Diploscapter pachys]|uniref:Uncharacterized protein n=1 Tax=Diploscapter pachys TaxID=2018661 RepID=A0A2A2M4A7_9BILA|nr:hypothetical protein WR25_13352 [Diploscapter pachys]